MASNCTQAPVRDLEMGTRNEANEEPHVDPHSERRLKEETKLLPSFKLPDKPRVRPPVLAVMAAKTFTKGNSRRQGAPPTNEGYKNLDSHEQDQNQESHEQGETQESGGQAGNHEDPGEAKIPVSGEHAGDQESPGQAEIQESPGHAVTQGSREVFGATSRSYIRMRHKALMIQFNSYAVLLVLLAGAMSVAILQPPGSFETNGLIRKDAQIYIVLASMSFLFAMAGIFSVVLGFHSLYAPVFYAPPRTEDTLDGTATSEEIDIIKVNISRLLRVECYLFASVLSCLLAFYCGLVVVSPSIWLTWLVLALFLILLCFETCIECVPLLPGIRRWNRRRRI